MLRAIFSITVSNNYELMAQTFSIQALESQGTRPASEQVYSNCAPSLPNLRSEYFGFAKAWATVQLNGVSSSSLDPGGCSAAVLGSALF